MNTTAPQPVNVSQSVLDEIVRRIVEVAEPEKIILFGSTARGDAGPDSDVDLLIVKECAHELRLMAQIYESLHGVRVAVDAIVVSPGNLKRYKDTHALVYKPALREGVVLYDAI